MKPQLGLFALFSGVCRVAVRTGRGRCKHVAKMKRSVAMLAGIFKQTKTWFCCTINSVNFELAKVKLL